MIAVARFNVVVCPVFPQKLLLFICFTSLACAAELKHFPISEFGAVADGKTINTAAIQKAIDQAAGAGGGVVEIPAGTFRSGSIFLKAGVELNLAENAVLLGSTDIEDYPKRETRIEGHFEPWRMALVNAEEIDHVRIGGKGVIDGNGITFWAKFWQRRRENPKCTNLEVERPRLMFIDRCKDVRIEGISLRYSGFWNLHIYRCSDVVVENLTIISPTRHTQHRNYMTPEILKGMDKDASVSNQPLKDNILGPSTDGIDIDSSQKVTVRKCYISVNDDNIALKGSKGPLADQDKDSPPVEDILVEDCEFGDGNGMITCGSEATLVRNVTARNCRITGDATMLTLKLRPDTPQHYENILIDGIKLEGGKGRMLNVAPWSQFFDLKGHAPPSRTVNNITIRNITGAFYTLGSLGGNPGDTLRDITLENIDLKLEDPGFQPKDVKNFVARNVLLNGKPY
ncbi:MAG: glycosyl hydrolase family 28 protein [Luteolibacter sp.]|uniref:glycoside hydrolase family 28 protein n=1 Tax=Luteolibacter sp. TaxID=1962973 RepID=UPI003267F1FD